MFPSNSEIVFSILDPPQLWLRLGQNLAEDQIKVYY